MRFPTARLRMFPLCAVLLTIPVSAAAEVDPLEALERAQQALFLKTAPAVVFIATPKGFGSGFFVSNDGLILTNDHVVGSQSIVDVVLHDGSKLKGKVVERAADNVDLALVQLVEPRTTPALALVQSDDLKVGAWVGAVGHGLGGIWTYSVGMVSNIYPEGSQRPIFQTQIPLNSGSSGGPMIDRHGRVVGVTTLGVKGANNVNFGIHIGVAFSTLKKMAAHCECLVIHAPAGLPIFVDGKMAGKGPRLVVPASAREYELFVVHQGKMNKQKVRFPEVREVNLLPQSVGGLGVRAR